LYYSVGNNIHNQLINILTIRTIDNMNYTILRQLEIMALTASALFLGLLWTNNVYALDNTTPASTTITTTPNKSSPITITSNSNSVYSIPSTSVQVDKFSANYAIAGKISSLNNLRNLITSTIVNDFDKNPNIGYIVESSSISQTLSTTSSSRHQPGLPNPFVSKDIINQKITNEIQHAIAASVTSSTEKYVEIKCTFGMTLANYKCS
jgi:hypothetical protein